MPSYILSIDQGTTGTTALIFDENLEIKGQATTDFPQHFPKAGWVEHDLEEIWSSVCLSVKSALERASVPASSIAAISLTNQRETSCLWDRASGKPVAKAIVWQDRRTGPYCEQLKKKGVEREIIRRSGLLLDPYFSATKIVWMLKNIPGTKGLAKKGKIVFGTIDSFLLFRLSGNHVTEPSNASRTLLMNLKTCAWDDSLIKLFGIPRGILPEIYPSAVEYGRTKGFPHLPDGIPITGMAGDQQAALFGQACLDQGTVKCTYGTGAFILANTGNKPVFSRHRLLTTVAWKIGDTTTYGLEGSAFIAGAAVQWARDGLGIINKSSEIEALARSVDDCDGVTFVPALSGIGAPHWLFRATGLLTGVTRRTTKGHIARAVLEGIAFQVRELLVAMTKDYGKKLSPIKVDGGASANNLLMQFQADILNTEIVRSKIMETTALGSGLQAGLAIGMWKSFDEIRKKWKSAEAFRPQMKTAESRRQIGRWDKAVSAVKLLANVR
ncbi:MAG: glycerol kinase GlpK [Deltaproteobacteria bacterium]|nr:glycerol kinase GlpK [Deltaproteobacteria bacterium]